MTDIAANTESTAIHGAQLRSIVERIERLTEDKAAVNEDIKGVYAEAAGNGFDAKIIRKVVAARKKSSDERSEEEAMMGLYLDALGMAQ